MSAVTKAIGLAKKLKHRYQDELRARTPVYLSCLLYTAPMLLSDYTPDLATTHHIAGCSVEAMQTLFDQIVSGTAGT